MAETQERVGVCSKCYRIFGTENKQVLYPVTSVLTTNRYLCAEHAAELYLWENAPRNRVATSGICEPGENINHLAERF